VEGSGVKPEYIAAIDPGKSKSAMVIFTIEGNNAIYPKEIPRRPGQIYNPYMLNTPILWEPRGFWLKTTTGIIIVETGYISVKNKKVTADHILLCGKIIGGLTAKGYEVHGASPLRWIPDMLSTSGKVPDRAQAAKLMKMRVDALEPGGTFNVHQRAAYLMGLWWWEKHKMEDMP
jgi:hypothetical protein